MGQNIYVVDEELGCGRRVIISNELQGASFKEQDYVLVVCKEWCRGCAFLRLWYSW